MSQLTPLFLPSAQGQLFATYYPVSGASQCIVHIPAFAEEMNKSRHMIAMQASTFTQQGYSVLIFDLWGTGDSEGDFSEATWHYWLSDIDNALNWLQKQGYQTFTFWSLRTGSLLAMDYLHQFSHSVNRLIAWQPILSGKTFIMQFLRLRIAANLMDKSAPQEKVTDLKALLQSGQSVEVAGYQLNPELILPMSGINLQQINLSDLEDYQLFELVMGEKQEAGFAMSQWVKRLEQEHKKVSLQVIQDNLFWSTQEISISQKLLEPSLYREN